MFSTTCRGREINNRPWLRLLLVVALSAVISQNSVYAEGSTNSLIRSLGFAGEWMLPGGLVYLRARAYNPVNGQFLQRDSFAGFLGTPQTQNRSYYTNNPVNWVDPSGYTVIYPEFDDLLPRGKGYLPKGEVRNVSIFSRHIRQKRSGTACERRGFFPERDARCRRGWWPVDPDFRRQRRVLRHAAHEALWMGTSRCV